MPGIIMGMTASRGMGAWVFVAATTVASGASAQTLFEATDGFVVMEAESVPTVMGWETETPGDAEAEKARGDVRYFNSEEASICNSSVNKAEGYPTLEYPFRVSEGGVYWLKLNMRKQVHCVDEGSDGDACHSGAGCTSLGIQSEGDSCDGANQCWRSDISNDVFVNMETRDGAGVPWGAGDDVGIMKLFGGKADEYGWSGNSALDHNPPTYQLEPGDYVLHIRGRSRGLKLDRIILFHEDADESAAKGAPESPIIDLSAGTGGGSPGTTGSGGAVSTGSGSGTGAGATTGGSGGAATTPPTLGASGTEAEGGCAVGEAPGRSAPLGGAALLLGFAALARRRRR